MRARMALLVSGIEVELREVVLRDRPAHMLEISPKGTVPVLLLDDGTVIEESMDIMHWALDESYFVGDWQQLVDGNDGDFKHHLDRYKYNNRYENPLSPEEHRSQVVTFLEGYNTRLAQTSFLAFVISPAFNSSTISNFQSASFLSLSFGFSSTPSCEFI